MTFRENANGLSASNLERDKNYGGASFIFKGGEVAAATGPSSGRRLLGKKGAFLLRELRQKCKIQPRPASKRNLMTLAPISIGRKPLKGEGGKGLREKGLCREKRRRRGVMKVRGKRLETTAEREHRRDIKTRQSSDVPPGWPHLHGRRPLSEKRKGPQVGEENLRGEKKGNGDLRTPSICKEKKGTLSRTKDKELRKGSTEGSRSGLRLYKASGTRSRVSGGVSLWSGLWGSRSEGGLPGRQSILGRTSGPESLRV